MSTSGCSERLSTNQMLPLFASDAETAQIHCIGYNVFRDSEMGRLIYNYNVSWSEKTNESFRIWERMIQQLLSTKQGSVSAHLGYRDIHRIRSSSTLIPRMCLKSEKAVKNPAFNEKFDIRVEKEARKRAAEKIRLHIEMISSAVVAIRVPVRCDGPCGGLTDVDYVQFGLCEHTICRRCYETVKGADHDGLRGCCNAECLELARNERHRRRRTARKEDRGRAKRMRSDVTFRMEYDNKDFEHLVEELRKAQKSPTQSARTDNCVTSFSEPAFSQS